MNVTPTELPGVLIIEPKVFRDERGFFFETFNADRYRELAGIRLPFVQDNYTTSTRGVLRGLHFQRRHVQGKLIRVVRGEVFDVAADVDPRSPTFGRWVGLTLSGAHHQQLWIPPGFAHGYVVLSDVAECAYKCTDYYDPNSESGVIWNDADLAIAWPIDKPTLSVKDQRLPKLSELAAAP
jgi:dTDP-4-dehydrorhamnose 3,5-epimerase